MDIHEVWDSEGNLISREAVPRAEPDPPAPTPEEELAMALESIDVDGAKTVPQLRDRTSSMRAAMRAYAAKKARG